jgi:pimeloyl-ACP methyl ester carboxylesterase
VSDLILYGGYLRGSARLNERMREQGEVMASAIRTGWGARNPASRRLFTTLYLPEGTSEQIAWFEELQRTTASPETAARIWAARMEVDVSDLAPRVTVPTLVLHARQDGLVPYKYGRELASVIPGAREPDTPLGLGTERARGTDPRTGGAGTEQRGDRNHPRPQRAHG